LSNSANSLKSCVSIGLAQLVLAVVLLAQSLHRVNARLHWLRQPIGQVSRLLASGIVQVRTGDYALHGFIVTD
jgi:hypothetical protein